MAALPIVHVDQAQVVAAPGTSVIKGHKSFLEIEYTPGAAIVTPQIWGPAVEGVVLVPIPTPVNTDPPSHLAIKDYGYDIDFVGGTKVTKVEVYFGKDIAKPRETLNPKKGLSVALTLRFSNTPPEERQAIRIYSVWLNFEILPRAS